MLAAGTVDGQLLLWKTGQPTVVHSQLFTLTALKIHTGFKPGVWAQLCIWFLLKKLGKFPTSSLGETPKLGQKKHGKNTPRQALLRRVVSVSAAVLCAWRREAAQRVRWCAAETLRRRICGFGGSLDQNKLKIISKK